MSDNIFKNESMSDLSFTQATMYMRKYNNAIDVRNVIKPPSILAAVNNRKMKRVVIRDNGKSSVIN